MRDKQAKRYCPTFPSSGVMEGMSINSRVNSNTCIRTCLACAYEESEDGRRFHYPDSAPPGFSPDDSDGDLTRAPNRPQPTSRADFGDKTPPGAPPVIAGTLRAVLAAAPLPESSGYH